MPADAPVRAPRVPPGLAGPLRLQPFRARRLALGRVAGVPGEVDAASAAALLDPGATSVDAGPALHVHEYAVDGTTVRGLVGLLPLGGVGVAGPAGLLPHEAVEVDRAERLADEMAAAGLDPAPVLLLQDAVPPSSLAAVLAEISETEPVLAGTDARGVAHRLWRTPSSPDIEVATGARCLLADGHHRWAAHLALASGTGPSSDGRALVMVVPPEHAPRLHAIHRVVAGTDLAAVTVRLEAAGFTRSSGAAVVRLDDGSREVALAPPDGVATLDLVHLVDDALAAWPGASRSHHHDVGGARLAAAGRGVAVLLPTPGIEEVWAAAAAGRPLPPKATSFQPKPPLGVLFRSWHDG